MTALSYLIPIALGLGAVGLVAFLWALRSGQFDDLEGASFRILDDEDKPLEDRPLEDATLPLSPDETPDKHARSHDLSGEK